MLEIFIRRKLEMQSLTTELWSRITLVGIRKSVRIWFGEL